MAVDRSEWGVVSTVAAGAGPRGFFAVVYATFRRAEQAAGNAAEHFYSIGGHTIRLRFAGPALAPFISPALEHLAEQPNRASELDVCLWDSVSTGVEMPPPPWSTDDYVARGEVRGYNDERIRTVFQLGPGILNMIDLARNAALFWIRDATAVPYYESGAPLRTILHWWMPAHGCHLVHAAAVGTPGGGVLLAGKGGTGKSTTALACLSSPLLYAGDDYVLVSAAPYPFVHSLYNSAKLDADHLQRLPHLRPLISNAGRLDREKALIYLYRHRADQLTTGFPIRAILLPQVTGQPHTTLHEASPAASLAALAPSTIFQLPGAGREAFEQLAELVRQVPSYTLELGTELSQIPEVVLALLTEA